MQGKPCFFSTKQFLSVFDGRLRGKHLWKTSFARKFSKNIHSFKETSTSRHEEVQRRREASLAKKREKILADVERTDQKAREARRRNRWSWGGNVTGEDFS